MSEHMSTNEELPENVAELPEIVPASAEESAPKKVIGRPITKETAKQYQLSAARAKRLRKQARADMLNAMCTKLNLGDELVKAFTSNDEKRIAIVEKALRIVGLTHDQSSEALAKRFEVKADQNVNGKIDNTMHFIIEEAKAPQEEGNG